METKLVKLKFNNESIFPVTSSEAVVVSDNGSVRRLDAVIKDMLHDILENSLVYDPLTETLVIGGLADDSTISYFRSEIDLTNPENANTLIVSESEFDNEQQCTKIKGILKIPNENRSFILITFKRSPEGLRFFINGEEHAVNNLELVSQIDLNRDVSITISDYTWITKIQLLN